MKKQFFTGLLVMLSLECFFTANCQYSDSSIIRRSTTDSLPAIKFNWKTATNPNLFPYKKLILPATLIAYGVVSLHSDALQDINKKVKEEVYTERDPKKMYIDNYLQYSNAAAVYALNIAGIHGKNNFRDRTMIYGISSLIMGATVFSVKKIAGESRPDASNNFSFPSGHTANAFAGAEFLRQEYKDVSPWYGIAGYAVAVTTGYLRIQNNKHWAGDVLAGAGVGIMSARLAYWIYPVIKRNIFKNKDVHTVVLPSYQNGQLGVGMMHQF
jgi:membrane-associated phospholipid phosphatase